MSVLDCSVVLELMVMVAVVKFAGSGYNVAVPGGFTEPAAKPKGSVIGAVMLIARLVPPMVVGTVGAKFSVPTRTVIGPFSKIDAPLKVCEASLLVAATTLAVTVLLLPGSPSSFTFGVVVVAPVVNGVTRPINKVPPLELIGPE